MTGGGETMRQPAAGAWLLIGICPADSNQDVPAPAQVIASKDWNAIVMPFPSVAPKDADGTAALALRQARILSAIAARHDVLPVSLGAAFSGASAVSSYLADHASDWTAAQDAVRGCAEWALKLEVDPNRKPDATNAPASISGSDFLARRRAARDARRHCSAARADFMISLQKDLARHSRDLQRREALSKGPLADWAILVPRTGQDALIQTLSEPGKVGQAGTLGLKMTLTGPLAPYSFVPAMQTSRCEHA